MNSIGNDVVIYIEKTGLSLNPENFSVIYEVLSGENRFLRERFETISESGDLSDHSLKSLYKDYIFQKQLHATILAEEEVAKTLDLINRVHSRLNDTTQALDSIQETLEFRSQVIEEIDTKNEIEMLKDTLSHDINTLIYEINDSNLWIKYRQKVIHSQLLELKSQHRIHYQDNLTGLPNKYFLKQKLYATCDTNTSSSGDEQIYLGKITLDNLTHLNKIHNRAIGDAVLRKLGQNIQNVISQDWEIFRVDGNDFALSGPQDAGMNEMTMKLIALKQTFSGKKFRSKLSEQPVVISIDVKTITLIRATASDDVFEAFEIE